VLHFPGAGADEVTSARPLFPRRAREPGPPYLGRRLASLSRAVISPANVSEYRGSEVVASAVLSDARFEALHLVASLAVWAADTIRDLESSAKGALSTLAFHTMLEAAMARSLDKAAWARRTDLPILTQTAGCPSTLVVRQCITRARSRNCAPLASGGAAIRALAQSLTCPHGVKAFVGRDPADSRDVGQRQYDVLSSGQAVGRAHSGSRYRRRSRLDLRIRKDAKVPSKDPC
jgi:hypothetical protein